MDLTATPTEVAPDQIESTLDRIWLSMQGAGKMRASLFNLIFYTEKNLRASYIQKVAMHLIEKFPARILLISTDRETKEPYLTTKVSVLSGNTTDAEILCDCIDVQVSSSLLERVPFILLPHILPDLPVYLVWAEDPTCHASLSLDAMATRVIYDSETTGDLCAFAKLLLQQHVEGKREVADLNWARLENLRDVLFATFLPESKRQCLDRMQEVQIVYNAQETAFFCHTKIQAIYLQSWIACRLGWACEHLTKEEETLCFQYQHNGTQRRIVLRPEKAVHFAPGMVLSVDLKTDQGEKFHVSRNAEPFNEVAVEFSTSQSCEMPERFLSTRSTSGHSLIKEICHRGTSSHYLQVLQFLASMQELSGLSC